MIERLRILYMKMNQFKHFLERQLPSQKVSRNNILPASSYSDPSLDT